MKQTEGAERLTKTLPVQLESCSVLPLSSVDLSDAQDCVSACVLAIYHQIIMCLFPFGTLRDFVLKMKSHDTSRLAKVMDLPPPF